MNPDDFLRPLVDEVESRLAARLDDRFAQEPWIRIADAATYASCSADVLRRAAQAGKLKAGKVNSELRVKRSEIDRWMYSNADARDHGVEVTTRVDEIINDLNEE